MITVDTPNEALIDAYMNVLVTQRMFSENTVSSYERDLKQLDALSEGIAFAKLTYHHIRRLTSKLHAGGLNPRSIARKLSSWRGFYQWLSEEVGLPSNPVDTIKPPKRDKTLPQTLSVDDAVLLVSTEPLRSEEESSKTTAICNHAIFELLYSCGLRVSELVHLDLQYFQENGYTSVGWINLQEEDVYVTGKGSKQRVVPVGKKAMEAILAWLEVRHTFVKSSETDGCRALFINQRGHRISQRLIQMRIKSHAKSLGLPLRVHPHLMRHSFATHILQSSGDLRAVQELLGHQSIASTQVYTALDFMHLAKIYDSAHPRAKKK